MGDREDCHTEVFGEDALLRKCVAGIQRRLLPGLGGDAENTLPSISGRDIQKCYPGRKATYLPEEVICFKKFLQGRRQLPFSCC